MTARPWTDRDDATLAARWPDTTAQALAEDMGRSVAAIRCRATKLMLGQSPVGMAEGQRKRIPRVAKSLDVAPPVKQLMKWTPEEDEQLRALWHDHTAVEIAEVMGRTPPGVRHRAAKIGLGQSRHVQETAVARRLETLRARAELPYSRFDDGIDPAIRQLAMSRPWRGAAL